MTVNIVVRVYNAKAQKRGWWCVQYPSIHPSSSRSLSHRPITTHLHTFRPTIQTECWLLVYKYMIRFLIWDIDLPFIDSVKSEIWIWRVIFKWLLTYENLKLHLGKLKCDKRERTELGHWFLCIYRAWCRGGTTGIGSFLFFPPKLRHIGGSVLYIWNWIYTRLTIGQTHCGLCTYIACFFLLYYIFHPLLARAAFWNRPVRRRHSLTPLPTGRWHQY